MTLKLKIFLVAIQLAHANFLSYHTRIQHLAKRIYYGESVNIANYPYMVKIYPYKNENDYCGGSLITQNCILTAAHCAVAFRNSSIIIRGGETTINGSGGNRRWVSHIFIPESFDGFFFINDVAIMKLEKPMIGENISQIPLDFNGLAIDDMIEVLGWGTTAQGVPAKILQKINVNVMSKELCRQIYAATGIWITESMLCASNGKRDTCQGDSGGPVVRNGKQVGVITAGLACGSDVYPGVYTDLNNVMVKNFIEQIKNQRC